MKGRDIVSMLTAKEETAYREMRYCYEALLCAKKAYFGEGRHTVQKGLAKSAQENLNRAVATFIGTREGAMLCRQAQSAEKPTG